jgi:ketosteroid isomerase-like protein
MKAMRILIIAAIVVSSCTQQKKVNTKAEGDKLMQLSKDWSDLVKNGDIETIMEGWADDAVMMVPGLPPLKGKSAIRKYVEEGMKIPGFSIRWEPLEVSVSKSGDMAYLIERNEMIFSDSLGNPMISYNKVVTVWRKQEDESWKNVIDMWNSDPTGEF